MISTNASNKTFRNHERRIENIVQKAITAQVINLRVKDVCTTARVSRQTFYAHYSSVNDVPRRQEQHLQDDFKKRLGAIVNREVIFTIILTFVKDNSHYFSAAFNRKDLRMLTWMIDYASPRLIPNGVANHAYIQYRGSLKSTIQSWLVPNKSAVQYKQYLSFYVTELLSTRVMRSRLDHLTSLTKPTVQPAQIQRQTNIVQEFPAKI